MKNKDLISVIYDAFIFKDELDLLEIRLNELNQIVDRFVLVEATRTFQNNRKPLAFRINRQRFSSFLQKIIHITVDDFPPFAGAWSQEYFQRNAIMRGLIDCQPDDVILISDADEIPRPNAITAFIDSPGIKVLEQNLYYYFLNCRCASRNWLRGTRMLRYQDLTTPQEIREHKGDKTVTDAGWHFSYLGGVDRIIDKLESFSHTEYNDVSFKNRARLRRLISLGQDIFGRPYRFQFGEIDETYPTYIRANKAKFEHLIKA